MTQPKSYMLTCQVDCHPEPQEGEPDELRPDRIRLDGHRALIVVENALTGNVTVSVRGAADQDDNDIGFFRLAAWAEIGEVIAKDDHTPPKVRAWMERMMIDFNKQFTKPTGDPN